MPEIATDHDGPDATAKVAKRPHLLEIVLAAALMIAVVLAAWLLVKTATQDAELAKAQKQASNLTSQLAQAEENADAARAELETANSKLDEANNVGLNCAAAAALYSDQALNVVRAAQVGLNTPTALAYLQQAQKSQASANATGCLK
jgi:flagellar biosynthesis/type III secretory pathway M-ring protein FliF/YscJ